MSQPRYGKWYTCFDKYGLVHVTTPRKSEHRWYYTPWCDLRGDAHVLFETSRTPRNNAPLTCFGCIAFENGWTVRQ